MLKFTDNKYKVGDFMKYLSELENGGVLPVGVDDGYDEVKIVLPDGTCIRVPSHAKSGHDSVISFGDEEKTVFEYEVGNKAFMAGNVLEHDSTASDEYPLSDLNKVIVSHALRVAELTGKHDLAICSGLPLKKYYKMRNLNAEVISAKKKNLLANAVKSGDGYSLPTIKSHEVLAEGLAAWFDFITFRKEDGSIGRDKDKYNLRVAVIDIGGRTTDIAVIQKGQLEYARSSTIEVGMLSVKEQLKDLIKEEMDIEINNEQMFQALSEGKVKAWGEWHDIKPLLEESEQIIADRIQSESKRKLKNASDIDLVLFVGGTVNKIPHLIEGWFRHQKIADDPGFANARGMQKYAQMLLDN